MFEGWSEAEVREHQENLAFTDKIVELRPAHSWPQICAKLDLAPATAQRWYARRMQFEAGNARALLCGKSTGRTPLYVPNPEETMKLRQVYLKTNLATDSGSKTLAARMVANSEHASEELRHVILKPRASKHTLTKTVRDIMDIPPDLIRHHRSPKNNRLGGVFVADHLRMASDGTRRLHAGERTSWDDGSINLVYTVPWKWGGDKCSDKYGVKVGRFQTLIGHDDGSGKVPGFTLTMRPRESYRAADAVGAMFRMARDTSRPDEIVAEGGVWQSNRALDYYRLANIRMIDAKGRPHQKLVENWWNRCWSVMSTIDGQIGRFRGEMERENALLMKCQAGREDPRKHFIGVDRLVAGLSGAIEYLNADTIESAKYGRWIPDQRWDEDLAEFPRAPLASSLGWLCAPEQHEVTVRNGCMVRCVAMNQFGESLPYFFADPVLREFEGCKVRVYFDPFDDPCTASAVLLHEAHGVKAGEQIAVRMPLLNEIPSLVQAADGWEIGMNEGGMARALRIRKETAAICRTEYRDLVGKRKISEARDHKSAHRVEITSATAAENRNEGPATPRESILGISGESRQRQNEISPFTRGGDGDGVTSRRTSGMGSSCLHMKPMTDDQLAERVAAQERDLQKEILI